MAALDFRVTTGTVTLTGTVPMTVLQLLAPANQRVRVKQITVTFDGITSSAVPVAVSVYRQTTAGTVSATPPTPVLTRKGLAETVQTVATWKATAEPTYGDLLHSRFVPAFNGTWDLFSPYSQEIEIQGGGRLGIVCNAPANVDVNVSVACEE